MTIIKLKRVYADYEEADGFRVLVDRLWPRGMKKENLKLDMWAKDITPSTELRKWFHEDPDTRFEKFEESYIYELDHSQALSSFVDTIKKYDVVTLLFASKNETQNHAIVLKTYLDKELNKSELDDNQAEV